MYIMTRIYIYIVGSGVLSEEGGGGSGSRTPPSEEKKILYVQKTLIYINIINLTIYYSPPKKFENTPLIIGIYLYVYYAYTYRLFDHHFHDAFVMYVYIAQSPSMCESIEHNIL